MSPYYATWSFQSGEDLSHLVLFLYAPYADLGAGISSG